MIASIYVRAWRFYLHHRKNMTAGDIKQVIVNHFGLDWEQFKQNEQAYFDYQQELNKKHNLASKKPKKRRMIRVNN